MRSDSRLKDFSNASGLTENSPDQTISPLAQLTMRSASMVPPLSGLTKPLIE